MVLEDDADLRETLAAQLRRSGYDVRCAADGAQALAMFEEHQLPGVVLSDLLIPGIVGMSIIEYMRQDLALARVPVAIITGSPELAPAGIKLFIKPAPYADILGFVKDALGGDDGRCGNQS